MSEKKEIALLEKKNKHLKRFDLHRISKLSGDVCHHQNIFLFLQIQTGLKSLSAISIN